MAHIWYPFKREPGNEQRDFYYGALRFSTGQNRIGKSGLESKCGICHSTSMAKDTHIGLKIEQIEYCLQYAAFLTLHYGVEYGVWLRTFEAALEEARKDDVVSRAAMVLAAIPTKAV